jgi:hypothetical protein
MTSNRGLVVRLVGGEVFHLTIQRAR